MHPAPSIIVFTVLSGLGLGQMVWLGLGMGPDEGAFRWVATALAFAITGLGGIASTGHLGKRENAWRAFSQWRSSWLSREACLMLAAMAVFGLYAAIWCMGGERYWGLGWQAALLDLATIYSTAMINAQLKTEPRWGFSYVSGFTVDLEARAGFKRIERRFEARVTDVQFFFASPAAEAEYDSRRDAALQLASALSAIANGGYLMKPHLVKKIMGPDGTVIRENEPEVVSRVLSYDTAASVTRIMERVVEEGTG